MLIRCYRQSDLWAVHDLALTNLKERYNPSLYDELSKFWPEGFLVAEEMGRIVGFIFTVMSSDVEARILMLAVRSEIRNHGIGTALCRRFLVECANRGVRSITLEVRSSNLQGIRFYQRLGFSLAGRIPQYYSNGEDGFTLSLHL